MRKRLAFILALFVVAPAAAQAQWNIGARLGYALPMGDGDGSAKMSDIATGQVTPQLDVDYVTNQLSVGGYFSYGFGDVAGATKDLCTLTGTSCSTNSLRIGAQLAWRFDPQPPGGVAGPWFGVGLGYESLTVSGANDLTISGTEFLILQGGHDWPVSPNAALGVYASFSLGQYSDISGSGMSGTIADKKMHEWFTFGVRGILGFPR
jgi:hypothetical protein